MDTKTSSTEDPLVSRVGRVVDLVHQLRQEVADIRTELAQAQERLQGLESERGTVRQKVQRMLEYIGS